MAKSLLPKIPTEFLPESWAEKVAEEFDCSENTVERVVYGIAPNSPKNQKLWDRLFELAEEGKEELTEREKRVANLSNA